VHRKKAAYLDFFASFLVFYALNSFFIAESFELCSFLSEKGAYQPFFTTFEMDFFNSHHPISEKFAGFS